MKKKSLNIITDTPAMNAIKTDKKTNAAYWDAIDDTIETCIKDLTPFSAVNITSDNDEIDLYSDGIIGEVRDRIIEYLTEKGCVFPFVNENM